MACMTASGPAANRPPHCSFASTGVSRLPSTTTRLSLTRRSMIAAAAGLAGAVGAGKSGFAQVADAHGEAVDLGRDDAEIVV